MRRLAILVGGALVLGACASGPVVGGDVADGATEQSPVVDEQSTSVAESNDGSGVEESTPATVQMEDQSLDTATSDHTDVPSSSDDELAVEPDVTPTTEAPKPPPPSEPPPPTTVEFAVADLAGRVAVATASVTVVSIEEVTWPDGSLGCPQPGMSYTQSLVNGTRVVLEIGGVQYEYHSGPDGELFYCANPTAPVADSGYGDV